MRYLIFNTRADARSRNGTIATGLGCGQHPDDVTRFWFSVVEHPSVPLAAFLVPEGEEHLLTVPERDRLLDHAVMEQQGWFPAPEV